MTDEQKVPKRLLIIVPPDTEVMYMTSPGVDRVMMADVEAFTAAGSQIIGPHPSFFGEPLYRAPEYKPSLRLVDITS